MEKKEIVKELYTKAIDFYKTADIPQNFLEALTTVESSIHKFGIDPADIIQDTVVSDVDWERLIYQIVFDLQHGWYISSLFDAKEDAVGQKNLAIAFADFLNKEGYSFSKTHLNDESFEKLRMKYSLV